MVFLLNRMHVWKISCMYGHWRYRKKPHTQEPSHLSCHSNPGCALHKPYSPVFIAPTSGLISLGSTLAPTHCVCNHTHSHTKHRGPSSLQTAQSPHCEPQYWPPPLPFPSTLYSLSPINSFPSAPSYSCSCLRGLGSAPPFYFFFIIPLLNPFSIVSQISKHPAFSFLVLCLSLHSPPSPMHFHLLWLFSCLICSLLSWNRVQHGSVWLVLWSSLSGWWKCPLFMMFT